MSDFITEYPRCNGCGYCCFKCQCGVSVDLYGYVPEGQRCPALTWMVNPHTHKGRYVCKPALTDIFIQSELAIGAGCSSSLNTWRLNVCERVNIEDSL
jgi:hypothetical protein